MRAVKIIQAPIGAAITVGFFVYVLLDAYLLRHVRLNIARRAMRPIVKRLAPVTPTVLAKHGRVGDLWHPARYQLYLLVDHSKDLAALVRSAAAESGFRIDVARRPGTVRSGPMWTYFIARKDGGILAAEISWNTPVRVSRTEAHRREVTPPSGKAILSLALQTRKR